MRLLLTTLAILVLTFVALTLWVLMHDDHEALL
jgi:hypothetical protein